ncbi:MAG: putative quinol monooxygenase [Eubacteriaceae bacterium]
MLKVVAKNFAQKESIDKIIELCKELVETTRREIGCIKYEMYQDENDPTILTIIEEWESKHDLENHMESEHFTRIVPMIEKFMIKKSEINIYNKLI